MITIITCSIKPDVCKRMLDSVSMTIGAEYEVVVFDNREKQYGICKAYNEAAKKSKGTYLCFVHEDIEIQTTDWGKNLIEFVNKTPNCGVIGLAGGFYAPRNFTSWYVGSNAIAMKIHDLKLSVNQELTYQYFNPNDELFSRVICIDGVFLFVRRDIWQANKFDEQTFQGFHFYDADFSLAIAQEYQNYVYFGMDVYHYSRGNVEKTYCDNMYIFQKKWKGRLPYCQPGYRSSFINELRKATEVLWLYIDSGFSMIESYKRIYRINGIVFFICFWGYKCRKIFFKKTTLRK